jgi:hypothetical protein
LDFLRPKFFSEFYSLSIYFSCRQSDFGFVLNSKITAEGRPTGQWECRPAPRIDWTSGAACTVIARVGIKSPGADTLCPNAVATVALVSRTARQLAALPCAHRSRRISPLLSHFLWRSLETVRRRLLSRSSLVVIAESRAEAAAFSCESPSARRCISSQVICRLTLVFVARRSPESAGVICRARTPPESVDLTV